MLLHLNLQQLKVQLFLKTFSLISVNAPFLNASSKDFRLTMSPSVFCLLIPVIANLKPSANSFGSSCPPILFSKSSMILLDISPGPISPPSCLIFLAVSLAISLNLEMELLKALIAPVSIPVSSWIPEKIADLNAALTLPVPSPVPKRLVCKSPRPLKDSATLLKLSAAISTVLEAAPRKSDTFCSSSLKLSNMTTALFCASIAFAIFKACSWFFRDTSSKLFKS